MLRLLVASIVVLCALPVRAEVQVLTSIAPLQLIAAAVQEGLGQPQVLLPPGASAHHYSLRPSDVRQVHQAHLFYWVGPDLERFLAPLVHSREGTSLAVQELPNMHLRRFAEHDDGDEHAGHQDDHDHRPGSVDAHLWLLPANALLIAQRMATDLSALDPQNAAAYQANVAAFAERLAVKNQQLEAQLSALQTRPFFVFHQAYDYFESAYGLKRQGVFSIGGDVQPGARHVAKMRAALQAAGPVCVFSEPPLPPKLAQTLSSGLPVQLAELDVLGAGLQVNATGYEQLLQNLADGFTACLSRLPND